MRSPREESEIKLKAFFDLKLMNYKLESPGVVFFEKAWIDSETDKLNVKYYLLRDLICFLSYPKCQTTDFNRVMKIDDEVEIKLYKEKGETAFLDFL